MVLQEVYYTPPGRNYDINIDLCFPTAGASDTDYDHSAKFDAVIDYTYGASAGQLSCTGTFRELVSHGYVAGYVQWPGTGESGGGFADLGNPQFMQDMVDATYFLAAQDWSTKNFGATGASGDGANLVNVAALLGQHKDSPLKAIIPQVTTNNGYESFFPGGMQATWLPAVGCAATNGTTDANNGTYNPTQLRDGDLNRELAIRQGDANEAVDRAANEQKPPPCLLFDDYNKHPTYDSWWEASRGKLENISIPMWVMGSFDDLTNSLTSEVYTGWGPYSPPTGTRNMLSMGFFSHVGASPSSEFDTTAETVKFFDHWLRGINNGIEKQAARYRYRYENENEWIPRIAENYPIPGTQFTDMFIDAGSPSPLAAGALTLGAPSGDVSATYAYVPDDGIRGFSSGLARARSERQPANRDSLGFLTYNDPSGRPDQRTEPPESRVAFLSEPVTDDVTLTGRPTMTLYATTTSPDTDFVVRLIDVVPDDAQVSPNDPQPGMWRVITNGRLKGTFRSYLDPATNRATYTQPTPIPTGEVVKYEIALDPTGWLIPKGHRLGVLVMSSDVPYTYPNLNPAVISVISSPRYPSHISLPVIPAGASCIDANADGVPDDSNCG